MGKGRVFVRELTSETYGLGHHRKAQLAVDRVRDDSVVVDDGQRRPLRVSERAEPGGAIWPGDDPFLTQTVQVHFVEIPARAPTRGTGTRTRRPSTSSRGGLRDPRRPALRLGDRRPGLRAHRLRAPALQPLRREGRRPRHQGQVHLDVPGAAAAGEATGPSRGAVRPAPRLVAIWTAGVLARSKVVTAADYLVGGHRSRPGPGDLVPERPTVASLQRRRATSCSSLPGGARAGTGRWPTRSSTCSRVAATPCSGRSRPRSPTATTPGSPTSRAGSSWRPATCSTSRRTTSASCSPPTVRRCACSRPEPGVQAPGVRRGALLRDRRGGRGGGLRGRGHARAQLAGQA